MMKKLGGVVLTIAFLLSTFSFLPVKRASANTGEERRMLMAAWPWEYYHSSNGSNHNPGSSAVQDQTDNQKTIQQTAQTTILPQDSNKQKSSQRDKGFSDWLFKISLYLRILLR